MAIRLPQPGTEASGKVLGDHRRVDSSRSRFRLRRINAVKMLFWSAILNGLLAPPLVVIVVLLTSDKKVMGHSVNSISMKVLGWACALIMSAAAAGLIWSLR